VCVLMLREVTVCVLMLSLFMCNFVVLSDVIYSVITLNDVRPNVLTPRLTNRFSDGSVSGSADSRLPRFNDGTSSADGRLLVC
jgi:hypothetical protein